MWGAGGVGGIIPTVTKVPCKEFGPGTATTARKAQQGKDEPLNSYSLYGRRGAGKLTVCGRFGKQDHICLLYCRACKYRFSEHKGTPLFGSHLPEDKARSGSRNGDAARLNAE